MSGYNPYRKSNGEFASKDDVGSVESKVENDLREAQSSGDHLQAAQIESYAMDKLPESKLGKRLLERTYGSVPAIEHSTAPPTASAEAAPESQAVEVQVEKPTVSAVVSPTPSKPKRNRAMSHYELSDQQYDINTARLEEKFYDSDGRVYTLVKKTPNNSAALFKMTDTDGNPLNGSPLRDPEDFDTFIEANDREAAADLRKLKVPSNPIGAQERNPGKWTEPVAGAAIGSWKTGTERPTHWRSKAGDRFYDELGNVYTVTGMDDDFTELEMTPAGKRVVPGNGRPMVLERNDRRSRDALRALHRPSFANLIRSFFDR